MKKTLIIVLYVALSGSIAIAQTVRNDVMASGGGHASAGNIVMEYTVGEPVIETLDGTHLTITEGFHQPLLVVTSIDEYFVFPGIEVFPNPTYDKLYIDIPAEKNTTFDCLLYDANGKLLMNKSLLPGKNTIPMENVAPGMYILNIQDNNTGEINGYKISRSVK
ncbi:MAG: T9SS type A sorting domain-containing protein [Bacteroidota bacterium]|nr:T9SS type A sorting domain-containing protein [Bacteroidota bacterium]